MSPLRRTLVTLGAVVAVIAIMIWLRAAFTPTPTSDPNARPPALWDAIDESALTAIEIDGQRGAITLVRDAGGAWNVTEPVTDRASDEAVHALLAALADVRHVTRLDASTIEGALHGVGLDGPDVARVTLLFAEGARRTLEVGAVELASGYRAARIDGETRLHLVEGQVRALISPHVDDMRLRRLVVPPIADWDAFAISRGARQWSFERGRAGTWWARAPIEDEADAARVAVLASAITDARIERFLDLDSSAAARDAAELTISITMREGPSSSITLEGPVPEAEGLRLARVAGRTGVFAVRAEAIERALLPEDPDAWRSPLATDVAAFDVMRLEARAGERHVVLERASGADDAWTARVPAHASVDAPALTGLLGSIARLEVSAFGAPGEARALGLDPPRARILLALRDGSRIGLAIGETTADGTWVRRDDRPLPLRVNRDLTAATDPESLTVSYPRR